MDKKSFSSYLLDDFPLVSNKQWAEVVYQDLKGESYSEKLHWKTVDGIELKPYYRKESLSEFAHILAQGQSKWDICQKIVCKDDRKSNQALLKMLNSGVNAPVLHAKRDTNWDVLLKDVLPSYIKLHIRQSTKEQLKGMMRLMNNRKIDKTRWVGTTDLNLQIGKDIASLWATIDSVKKKIPAFKHILIDIEKAHCLGANNVWEIALALASAQDYIRQLEKSASAENVLKQMHFSFSVDNEYFLQIAKIRAFRQLWETFCLTYNTLPSAYVLVNSSLRTYTL